MHVGGESRMWAVSHACRVTYVGGESRMWAMSHACGR